MSQNEAAPKKVYFIDVIFAATWNLTKAILSVYQYSFQSFSSLTRHFWINSGLGLLLMLVWGFKGTHLLILHRIWPSAFTYSFILVCFRHYKVLNHLLFLLPCYVLTLLFWLGIFTSRRFKKMEYACAQAGIKNNLGQLPKPIKFEKLSSFRTKIRFFAPGIAISDFEAKKKDLESALNGHIENILKEAEPRYTDLYVTKKLMPEKVLYSEASKGVTEPYSFIVGESLVEMVIQSICELPHMLVAGATGMGKSAFLRSVTMAILEKSTFIQIYLLDLKRGLELSPFTKCPNVKMAKDIQSAIGLLRQICEEMERRFEYLEKNGFNLIDPKRDKMDRIIIIIDEASVLYTESKTNKVYKKLAQEATEITDKIAKLSRAAGIHLVFATQRVSKETISTSIQDNVEGRMCFAIPSFTGSTLVLGNDNAARLSHIPGRGIWKMGTTLLEVQSPFIKKEEIEERCNVIVDEFCSGKRKNFNQMLSTKLNEVESDGTEEKIVEAGVKRAE